MTGVIEWMQIAVTSESTDYYAAYRFNTALVDFFFFFFFLVGSQNNSKPLKLIFISDYF